MVNFLVPNIGQSFAQGAEMAEQAEDRRLAREDRTLMRQTQQAQLKLSQDAAEREKQKLRVDQVGRALFSFSELPQDQQIQQWGRLRQELTAAGENPNDMPQGYDPGYVEYGKRKAMTIAEHIKAQENKYSNVAPGGTLIDNKTGKPIFQAPEKADNTLVEIADATSPTGTRMVPRAKAVNQPGKPPNSMVLESDGKGGFTMTQGRGATPSGLQKPTLNAIEEKQIDAQGALSRLTNIEQSFKPEYLQLGPRAGMAATAMKEFLGAPLSPEQQQQLTGFTEFRRATTDNLNRTIKDITGSAMGVEEAQRIISTMPSAGTGVFDGDSPTQFKTKLDGATKDVRNALIRYTWAKKNGLDPLKSGIELNDVPALVNKRGAEIEAQIKAQYPNATPEQIRMERNARVASEFGLAR
jgi:hypothetical protein